MMKKHNSGKSQNMVQVSQDDASRLVGGIIEKGFSGESLNSPLPLSSAPRATVLPFPVARHRSHGPHWAPNGSDIRGTANADGDNDNDNDDEEGENFNPIAAFANPVKRKQKKGLDFSRWREVTSDNSSVFRNKEESKVLVKSQPRIKVSEGTEIREKINRPIGAGAGAESGVQLERKLSDDTDAKAHDIDMKVMDPLLSQVVKKQEGEISDMDVDGVKSYLPKDNQLNQGTKHTPLRDECGGMSLESQIDAENRAQLERMSADEIAEAQAELMKKMDPALIEVLKKRGQDKLKKQKCFTSDVATSDRAANLQDEKISINASSHSDSDISHKVTRTTADSKDAHKELDDSVVKRLTLGNGSLWDSWSKRVEAVRELRFSFDGNVIESDSVQVLKTDNMSANSGYSADNVSERDFLRTEGDPAAAGYTIKEALALTRSVVPGQRALALHLIASVLDKVSHNICQNEVECSLKYAKTDISIDREAVWAFVQGPDAELALSLRMTLDDNHNSVVLACAKVIQCVLSFDINEGFFGISEKIATYQKDVCTAPIFRSRPKVEVGFLRGGFWKYNTKPSNIYPFGEVAMDGDDKPEGEHTIQDDIVVAEQDFAAGLVRMGILARIRYLLETDPSAALEECIISILIAVARHSPTCANAVMKCPRLVHTVVNRFTINDQMEINPSKIKSVTLLKVLARSDKENCKDFVKSGIFKKVTWHLYRYAFSLDNWIKLGRENCKLSAALLVEQFCLWKVCIHYGYCISYFPDLFPSLCIWLNVPTFEKLIENNLLNEFAAITKEAYLVLEALTKRLPNFYSHTDLSNRAADVSTECMETWCWSHVGPMVDLALKWIALKSDPYLSKFFDRQKGTNGSPSMQDSALSSLLWVISSVMHMLSSLLGSVIPEDTFTLHGGHVPWLPNFVPKVGLEIIKNGFLSFTGQGGSFLEYLCHLRNQSEHETSLASVSCLHGLVKVVISVNTLIRLAKSEIHTPPHTSSREDRMLADGILESSRGEMGTTLSTFMKLIANERQYVQSIEMFARGGPAPGVGLGWGASGGGFWSTTFLLAQMDASLLVNLLGIFQIASTKDPPTSEETGFIIQRINCALDICLIVGPRDRSILDKALDFLLQIPVLKWFNSCICHFLQLNKGLKLFGWVYEEEEYLLFSTTLASHFRNRWLCRKNKSKAKGKDRHVDNKRIKKGNVSLDTIHEDMDTSNLANQDHSLVVEWAHQRLPLPMHWFLSPISTIKDSKFIDLPKQDAVDFLQSARAGLFFLLGIEAMSAIISSELKSSVQDVPIVWKLHSLSFILFVGTIVIEEEKSRDVYENLQEVYGQLLDKSRLPEAGEKYSVELLKFQAEIDESYTTFIETLVEQFAAVSYGDIIFGRQIAIHLHRCVEAPVRLAAWNALSNARVLELLPPLEKCVARVEGYLEPVEDDERILEAYVKSWVSGALDRAATRGSVAFALVLHHLSSFIFGHFADDKISLRNKLAKSILRDYSRKPQHQGMMVDFIGYNKPFNCQKPKQEVLSPKMCDKDERFKILKEVCEGNSSLLNEVEKLEASMKKGHYPAP